MIDHNKTDNKLKQVYLIEWTPHYAVNTLENQRLGFEVKKYTREINLNFEMFV